MGIKVSFVQQDGVERTFDDAESGQSLMEVGRSKSVEGILADCGGSCACATCHVYVDPQWMAAVGPPDPVEQATLDLVADVYRSNSRLCCQIMLRSELDGIRVTVAPGV